MPHLQFDLNFTPNPQEKRRARSAGRPGLVAAAEGG
jgi:hypothetical protein